MDVAAWETGFYVHDGVWAVPRSAAFTDGARQVTAQGQAGVGTSGII